MNKGLVWLGVVFALGGIFMIFFGIWEYNYEVNEYLARYGYVHGKTGFVGMMIAAMSIIPFILTIVCLVTAFNFGKILRNDVMKLKFKIEGYNRKIREAEERGRSAMYYRMKRGPLEKKMLKLEEKLYRWEQKQKLQLGESVYEEQGSGGTTVQENSQICPGCGKQKIDPKDKFCAYCRTVY
ncbi:MAG: hypothetical protein ACFFCS_14615 [Candidatus Hodarchaeota archaeon]